MALIKWEIDFERIPTNISDTQVRERLNKRGSEGWEPYEIVGVTHFFKRRMEEITDAGKTIDINKKKK